MVTQCEFINTSGSYWRGKTGNVCLISVIILATFDDMAFLLCACCIMEVSYNDYQRLTPNLKLCNYTKLDVMVMIGLFFLVQWVARLLFHADIFFFFTFTVLLLADAFIRTYSHFASYQLPQGKSPLEQLRVKCLGGSQDSNKQFPGYHASNHNDSDCNMSRNLYIKKLYNKSHFLPETRFSLQNCHFLCNSSF